jgi:LPS-assembly protein
VAREARHTGFLIPTAGRSSAKGNVVGDSFYWAINRSLDATIGGEYFSKRGSSQRGEFRARPSDTSYVDLSYFGVIDRGFETGTSTGPQILREGGQEARLTAEGNFYGFRAVSNVDYLSSFLFRLAFNESFTQAINSEVKSQLFLSKTYKGFSLGGMVERYQNFFQTAENGVLSNPPAFDSIRILHTPSVDVSSVERPFGRWPLFWSLDGSLAGLSRSEPGFQTSNLLGRFDFNPEISLPLQWKGWVLRPALTLHETFYSERYVNGVVNSDATNRKALEGAVELRPPALEKVFDQEFLGRKWKHVIEPRIQYRYVTGIDNFTNFLHFDERDILSNTHEVQYGFVTRDPHDESGGRSRWSRTNGAVGASQHSAKPALRRGAPGEGGPDLGDRTEVFPRSHFRRCPNHRTAQRSSHDRGPDRHRISDRATPFVADSIAAPSRNRQPHRHRVGHGLRFSTEPN